MNKIKEITTKVHDKSSDVAKVINTLNYFIDELNDCVNLTQLYNTIQDINIWCAWAQENEEGVEEVFKNLLPEWLTGVLDSVRQSMVELGDFDPSIYNALGKQKYDEVFKTTQSSAIKIIEQGIEDIYSSTDAPIKIQESQCYQCSLSEEQKAYHGSRAYFKCFRAQYISNYAYGWGFYFAATEHIPTSYAGDPKSAKELILFSGKTPSELADYYDTDAFLEIPTRVKSPVDIIDWAEDMIEYLKERSEGDESMFKQEINDYEKLIKVVNDMQVETEPMSYVYEVLLHKGKKPDQYEYLVYEDPVPDKQFQKIAKALKDNNINANIKPGMAGSMVYSTIAQQGFKGDQKQASLFLLNKAKIDGITHSNGEVTIIFDEKAITIVNRCSLGKQKNR